MPVTKIFVILQSLSKSFYLYKLMKLNLSERLTSAGNSAVSSSDVTDLPMLGHQGLLPGKLFGKKD